MQFERLENALTVCNNHLDATGARGTEIESYLVGYVLITACAEFEMRFEAMINKRFARLGDAAVSAFIAKIADTQIRVPNLDGMGAFLKKFGNAFRDGFISNRTAVSDTAFQNVITNRHLVAHSQGGPMTFADAEREIRASYLVFDATAIALGLTSAELAGFR